MDAQYNAAPYKSCAPKPHLGWEIDLCCDLTENDDPRCEARACAPADAEDCYVRNRSKTMTSFLSEILSMCGRGFAAGIAIDRARAAPPACVASENRAFAHAFDHNRSSDLCMPVPEHFDGCVLQTIEIDTAPYPATIFQDGNLSFFFPPLFWCSALRNPQALSAVRSGQYLQASDKLPVENCADCNNYARDELRSSIPPLCMHPETNENNPFGSWWPFYDDRIGLVNGNVYTAVFDLSDNVPVGSVEVILAASSGEDQNIESIKVCFAEENRFSDKWMETYGSWEIWSAANELHLEIDDRDMNDACIELVDGRTLRLLSAVSIARRVAVASAPSVRYVFLQVTNEIVEDAQKQPIIEKINIRPPDEVRASHDVSGSCLMIFHHCAFTTSAVVLCCSSAARASLTVPCSGTRL